MRKRLMLLSAILFFCLSASSAFGQVGIYVGLFGGYSSQKLSLPDVDFEADDSFVYGGKVGVRILMFGIEGRYFRAVHDISLLKMVELDWEGQTVDYNYFGLNVKLHFSFLIFHPYITGGYGYYTVDISEVGDDGKGGYNFGAGLEVKLGKKFSLGVEGLYNHVTLDIDNLDLGIGDFILTGGFNIYF